MSSAQAPVSDKYIYCPSCDYNLHGLPDGDCPECGIAFDRKQLSQSRVGRKESFTDVFGTLAGWPAMVWLALIPAISVVLLPFVMLLSAVSGSEYVGIICFSIAIAVVIGLVLYHTVLICKDLGRQTHRILRTGAPQKEHPSKETLFWLLLAVEAFAILVFPAPILFLFVVTST